MKGEEPFDPVIDRAAVLRELSDRCWMLSRKCDQLADQLAKAKKDTAEECAKLAEQHSYHSGAMSAARTIRVHFGLIKP